MKWNKKNLAVIVVTALLLVCFLLYFILTNGQSYRQVKYTVRYHSDTLVTGKDLALYAKKHCKPIQGELKRKVSLPQVESQIRRWPYCDSVKITSDIRGNVQVEMVQCKVLVRVFTSEGESYYIARQGASGKMVPYLEGRPLRVLVANGAVTERYHPSFNMELQDTSVCRDLFEIANFIDRHPFWRLQIAQIHVERKGMYRLAPLVGTHLITLGDARNLEEKFDNLWNLYKQGFNVAGWYRYAQVNLQFGDKIPCEKRSF